MLHPRILRQLTRGGGSSAAAQLQGLHALSTSMITVTFSAVLYDLPCCKGPHCQYLIPPPPRLLSLSGYISTVMFSSAIPGAPAWAQPPEVFDELIQVGHGSS